MSLEASSQSKADHITRNERCFSIDARSLHLRSSGDSFFELRCAFVGGFSTEHSTPEISGNAQLLRSVQLTQSNNFHHACGSGWDSETSCAPCWMFISGSMFTRRPTLAC